jgi:aerobic-type carbon monoxide dehydrogenase small subunit (CoxS/CutS family)
MVAPAAKVVYDPAQPGEDHMATFALRVNGAAKTVSVGPDTPLLYVLRNDLELNGPKFGCGLAQCGACTFTAERVKQAIG